MRFNRAQSKAFRFGSAGRLGRNLVRGSAFAAAIVPGLTIAATAKTLVLYSIYSGNVNLFDAFAGTALGEIAAVNELPSDVAVDGSGNVYVSELSIRPLSTSIYEYAPNTTVPDFTYDVPSENQPLLAVNAAGDLTTVVDARTFVFYAHGNREPIRTVSGSDVLPQKPAVAPDGTAWAMPIDLHSRTIETVAPGATDIAFAHVAGRFAPTGNAITVDRHGNVLVMEGPIVTVFDGATGKVRASVPLAGTFDGYAAMTLAPDEKHLFVGTQHGTIAIYAWPAGGIPTKTYAIPGSSVFALGYR